MPPPTKRAVKPGAIISKRGKKLVSLHAVLPPHILEQLTNGTIDSDDDEDGPVSPSKATATEPKSKHVIKRGADKGLSSLLSELGSVNTMTPKDTTKSASSKPEKMGAAFLQSTTTVVSRSKEAGIIRKNAPVVETVGAEINSDDESAPAPSPARLKPALVPAPRRQAAPHVPRPPTFQPPAPRASSYQQQPQIAQPSYNNSMMAEPSDAAAPNMTHRVAKKRSRREMEKALRSGNLTAIEGQDGIHTLEGDANVYVPDEESFNTAPTGSGVRVAPVAMYDTKTGADVVGANVSGKAKGKNQINHLMASAAAFEANQAQQTKLKTNRTNAKSKYGW